MEKTASRVFEYFGQFEYFPTIEEIYMFFPVNINQDKLTSILKNSIKKGSIVHISDGKVNRYQKAKYESYSQGFKKRIQSSKILISKSRLFLKIIEIIPTVEYLGLSGSLSMKNASEMSDIDLFVVTKTGALWQTRFVLLLYKHLLKVFSPQIVGKFCFNLFFQTNSLKIRPKKQTVYVGHEMLQLKTLVNKRNIYERLIFENRWVVKYFPNVQILSVKQKSVDSTSAISKLLLILEKICRKVQIWWLDRRGYKFQEIGNQVWFIQEDFEKKLR